MKEGVVMTRPDRLATLVGWTMAALGIAHVLATPHYEPGLDVHALWFASGGAALALVGWLNVLRVRHAAAAPPLATAALVANLGATAFAVALVPLMRVSVTHEPQVLLGIALGLAATLLTLRRASGAPAPSHRGAP
jgi:hypothetical protein